MVFKVVSKLPKLKEDARNKKKKKYRQLMFLFEIIKPVSS